MTSVVKLRQVGVTRLKKDALDLSTGNLDIRVFQIVPCETESAKEGRFVLLYEALTALDSKRVFGGGVRPNFASFKRSVRVHLEAAVRADLFQGYVSEEDNPLGLSFKARFLPLSKVKCLFEAYRVCSDREKSQHTVTVTSAEGDISSVSTTMTTTPHGRESDVQASLEKSIPIPGLAKDLGDVIVMIRKIIDSSPTLEGDLLSLKGEVFKLTRNLVKNILDLRSECEAAKAGVDALKTELSKKVERHFVEKRSKAERDEKTTAAIYLLANKKPIKYAQAVGLAATAYCKDFGIPIGFTSSHSCESVGVYPVGIIERAFEHVLSVKDLTLSPSKES